MRSRLTRIGLAPMVLGLLIIATGCDGPTPSVPERERDGAVPPPAAPGCGYALEPWAACEPSRAPAPACVVESSEGGSRVYDAAGRMFGGTDGSGGGWRDANDDEAESWLHEEIDADGCVYGRSDGWALDGTPSDGTLINRWWWPGTEPYCYVDIQRGRLLMARQIDRGCDCRDLVVWRTCEDEPGGGIRCVHNDREGRFLFVRVVTHDADGRLLSERIDVDRDGTVENEVVAAYDDRGRALEIRWRCAVCDDPDVPWGGIEGGASREVYVYEDDLGAGMRRETVRHDSGDDGSFERVVRTTWVDDREVSSEEIDTDGSTWRTETRYGPGEDDYTRIETVDGRMEWTVIVAVEGRRRTRTWIEGDDPEPSIQVTEVDADGRLVERTGEKGRYRDRTVFIRDARGRLLSTQGRSWVSPDGQARTCRVDYQWRGPCPTVPDFDGGGCVW